MANIGAEGNFILFRKSTGISHNSFGDMVEAQATISEYDNPNEWLLQSPDGQQEWHLVYGDDGWGWKAWKNAEAAKKTASHRRPKAQGDMHDCTIALMKINECMNEGRYTRLRAVLRDSLGELYDDNSN